MMLISKLLEDVLPPGAYFVLVVGEEQQNPDDDNLGFATDLAPNDAIKMLDEASASMKSAT